MQLHLLSALPNEAFFVVKDVRVKSVIEVAWSTFHIAFEDFHTVPAESIQILISYSLVLKAISLAVLVPLALTADFELVGVELLRRELQSFTILNIRQVMIWILRMLIYI